jgi:hypothetical protein
VLEKFSEPQKCYGHCDQPARLKILSEGDEVVVVIACPKGYVSRVVAYGLGDNVAAVRSTVERALGPSWDLRDEDFRVATRYAWDLGMEDSAKGVVFKAAYWTQNYGRTKSDAPDMNALFACTKCNSLFSQPVSSVGMSCPACAGK